jgi:predicted DNA-binding protein
MAKNVQMSIKMEPELRDRFLSVAAERHRPAAQIIRDLMRLYIAESESPNALTAQTLRRSRDGDDVTEASDLTDMLKQLGL